MGYRVGAKLLGASMWFFIFYRARQDGPVLLVSPALSTLAPLNPFPDTGLTATEDFKLTRTYLQGMRHPWEH